MLVTSGPEAIKSIINATIAPILKAAGYKKSATTWTKTFGDATALLNVQSSSANDSGEARFTINLGISHPPFHEHRTGHPLTGPLKEYQCDLRERLGQLTHGQDHWWTLRAGTDDDSIRLEVANAITNIALPWLETHTTLEAMLHSFIAANMYFDAAIASHLLGRADTPSFLQKALQDANPHFTATIQTWATTHNHPLT